MISVHIISNGSLVFKTELTVLPRLGDTVEIHSDDQDSSFVVEKIVHTLFPEEQACIIYALRL